MAWAGEAVVRRLADGDVAACGEFYDRYAPLVYPLILRSVRNPGVAADVLRDVFWEAWEAAGAYDSRRSPEAWIVARARARALERGGEPEVIGLPLPAGHEPFARWTAAYATGTLPAGERAELEKHVAEGCRACEAAVLAHEETLADGARAAPALAPPPGVRPDLMRRVEANASSRGWWRRRRRMRWILGTLAAVIGVAGWTAGLVASRYEARVGAMARETARVRADLRRQGDALRDRAAVAQGLIDLLHDPATRALTLRGIGPGAGSTGRVLWHETRNGHLFVADLPPAPAGKTYALWTIADGPPRAAGSFAVDAAGRGSRSLPPIPSDVRGFKVTLEAPEGASAPAGPPAAGPVVLQSP